MIIDLSQCIAMTLVSDPARLVCGQDLRIDPWMAIFQPGKQRGTEVETHVRVIVDKLEDMAVVAVHAGARIRPIAFACDAMVPIMVGLGGVLIFD